MSLIINKILQKENLKYRCQINHNKNIFEATLESSQHLFENQEYSFEMNYESIIKLSKIQNYKDGLSGIFPTKNKSQTRIIGKVSGIINEQNLELIDLYIQNGPEFITIDKKEIPNAKYAMNDGIEIVVQNLIIYVYL